MQNKFINRNFNKIKVEKKWSLRRLLSILHISPYGLF